MVDRRNVFSNVDSENFWTENVTNTHRIWTGAHESGFVNGFSIFHYFWTQQNKFYICKISPRYVPLPCVVLKMMELGSHYHKGHICVASHPSVSQFLKFQRSHKCLFVRLTVHVNLWSTNKKLKNRKYHLWLWGIVKWSKSHIPPSQYLQHKIRMFQSRYCNHTEFV